MKVSVLALSLFLLGSAVAEPALVYHEDDLGVLSCTQYIAKVATLFGKKDKAGFCNVKNQPALGTMAHCLRQGFENSSIEHSVVSNFIKSCSKYHLTKEELDAAYTNATDYLSDTKTVPGFNKTLLYSLPVVLKTSQIHNTYNSNYSRFFNFNWTTWFSVALISYWFLVMIVAGVCNLTYFLFPGFINSTFNGRISKTFRRYVTLPALFKTHASPKTFKFLIWMIPTRLESLLVFGWFILALAFQIAHIEHTPNNTVWTSEEAEMGRKIADRSGVMALFLIPVLILFAGRNNFLQWISGWSYARMVVLHKYTSRITFMMVVIHTAAMSCSGVGLGKFFTRNAQDYVRTGWVAATASAIIVIQSVSTLRKRNYELFLLIHIILAVIFIGGGWHHVQNDGYQQFFYAATAVWAFDRLIRFVRLFQFGVRTATVQLVANETLRVTVPRPKYWKPFPGCHAFIHFMRPTCWWQSHPFTIIDTKVSESQSTITFCIKVKGGVTHGLYQYLAMQPNHTANIKVSIEGPYGHRLPVDRFNNVIYLAGGNGVPGMYSSATDLLRRNTESTVKRIKFYWVISHWKSMEWFYNELKSLDHSRIEPIIYVTQPGSGLALNEIDSTGSEPSDSEEQERDSEKTEKQSHSPIDFSAIENVQKLKRHFPFIEFREGRPQIDALIHDDLAESEGTTCFVSCAHPAFVDHVRYAIGQNLETSKDRVDYFEQIQAW